MRRVRLTTWWDLPFVLALLACAWLLALGEPGGTPSGLRVVVAGRSRDLPLEPGRHSLAGPLGTSVIEVDARRGVRFVSSPCPYHLCVTLGRIHAAGEVRVCVPNRVLVELVGSPPRHELDGVTR